MLFTLLLKLPFVLFTFFDNDVKADVMAADQSSVASSGFHDDALYVISDVI